MPADLDDLLIRAGGPASRFLLTLHGVSRHRIDSEVRAGRLTALFPSTYCRPWDAGEVAVRERAALMSAGRAAALSHLSALRRWGLLEHAGPVHVTVPVSRAPRGGAGLVVHRVRRYPPVVRLGGDVTVRVAPALVGSWTVLARDRRRAPVIDAVRGRLVTPGELVATLDTSPRLPGRRELAELTAALAAGCESELEIWGHLRVFDVPGLDHGVRQLRVRFGGREFRLDLAYERERVAVELDGYRWHSSREQRERDMRRDATLAAAGWLTLRFSHRRLHEDPAGCRRDTLAALAARHP